MWETVAAYRHKNFEVFDKESNNLDEAFTAIINSEDVHRRRRKMEADALLKLEQEKILAQAEEAERALEERERKIEEEKKRMISTAPDRFMKKAWEVFEAKKVEFEKELFSIDQVMERREARLNLYKLLDNATEISSSYYVGAEENEVRLTIGTDADHVARYKDWLKSAEGKVAAKRTSLHIALTNLMAKIIDEKKKAKLFRSKKKSEKEILALTIIDEIEKALTHSLTLTCSLTHSLTHSGAAQDRADQERRHGVKAALQAEAVCGRDLYCIQTMWSRSVCSS
jgi:hypothetical protein